MTDMKARHCGITALIVTAAIMTAMPAEAVPVGSLKGQQLEHIYGDYAPGGDCRTEPRLTIGESGFAFRALGRTVKPATVEFAPSYMGPAYRGIAMVVFPFPRGSPDFGPVRLTINDGEKRGVIGIEADLPPGQRADPFHAAFTRAARLERCAPAAATAPSPPQTLPAPATPAPARATPAEWGNLAALEGRYPGDYDGSNIDLFERGAIAAALRAQLGSKFEVLKTNLAVVSPLERQGRVYHLSGNATHQGGVEQAYILIDPARRAVQVGLWEKGKLRVFAPASGGRIALPASIAALAERSPPETATALPGTPWELMPVAGRAPVAHVAAAGSPTIESFTLFCDNGRPVVAMLLNKPLGGARLTLSWNFAGELVNIPVQRANADGTFWQGSLAGSPLLARLVQRRDNAMLRIDGRGEGEASLVGAAAVLRPVMRPCARL